MSRINYFWFLFYDAQMKTALMNSITYGDVTVTVTIVSQLERRARIVREMPFTFVFKFHVGEPDIKDKFKNYKY